MKTNNPRKILILGATSDIAMALSDMYAREGAELYLAARDRSKMQELQSAYASSGVRAHLVEFDLEQPDAFIRTFDGMGLVPDVLIVAAGYLGDQERAESDVTELKRILDVNFTAAVLVTEHVANAMKRAGVSGGLIAGISSVAGERGRAVNHFYGSAKAGFSAYLDGLRARMHPSDIHVLTVKPGFVRTKMIAHRETPGLITASPDFVARKIYRALDRRKNTLFVQGIWCWIMLMVRWIPEPVFKRIRV